MFLKYRFAGLASHRRDACTRSQSTKNEIYSKRKCRLYPFVRRLAVLQDGLSVTQTMLNFNHFKSKGYPVNLLATLPQEKCCALRNMEYNQTA